MTSWLEWLRWLENSGLASTIGESTWIYPAVETLHIMGFVVLVGAAATFDIRLLGVSRWLPVDAVASHVLWWSRAGLAVAAPTGFLLFASAATETWANPAFRLKLALIAAAGLNAYVFHRWSFRTVSEWNSGVPAPARARAAGVLSLLLWAGVITCGRLIAYL